MLKLCVKDLIVVKILEFFKFDGNRGIVWSSYFINLGCKVIYFFFDDVVNVKIIRKWLKFWNF